MAKYIIEGSTPLRGKVKVPGNKNAVLPAMAACLLTDEQVGLKNVPRIRDVRTMALLLQDLSVRVEGTQSQNLKLVAKTARPKQPDQKLVADLRASILLLGPMLARFGRATIRHPGGDIIGRRSIDQHLDGLRAMGAKVEKSGVVNTLTVKQLRGAKIYSSEASVTATENLMMAAALAQGETLIVNAAREPHVFCLGELLKKMGAKIEGHGTGRVRIEGVARLHGAEHVIRPDHIEVGTWAVAAAATDGEIVIQDVIEEDLKPMLLVLARMGVVFEVVPGNRDAGFEGSGRIRVTRGELRAVPRLQANTWPGFPTDLMSSAIVLATQAEGMTLAHDWMYEGRMFFVDRLIKMGANIIIADPHRVIINGPTPLYGRRTSSPDIRAGMALVTASLVAQGESEINMVELIDRGYEYLDQRLTALGAKLKRVER